MQEQHVFEAKYRIYYSTKQPVPIAEVIQALQALDALLRSVPKVVEGLVGVPVVGSEFFVERIESGSLIEDVVVKLLFNDKAGLDAFLEKIRDKPMLRTGLIGLALGGVLVYGVTLATGRKEPPPNITATNNVIINIGGELKLTPEGLAAIVSSAVSSQRDTAQSAVKFFAPARSDPKASVTLQSPDDRVATPRVTFSPEAVAETPRRVDVGPNRKIEELRRVDVQIRAADRDSKKTGWAGKIEGKTGRVRLELDPSVDEADLFANAGVTADATIIYEPRGRGHELTPTKIFIRKIY